MKLFIDANVFIDVQRKRANWKASFTVIESVVDGKNEGHISALTPAIIYFLRRQVASEDKSRQETSSLIKSFKTVSLTKELINDAFKEERIDDFEDAIQFHSAKSRVKILVTRNKKDYRKVEDEIEILTPEEFMKKHRT